jgi:hypothetical protein
MGLGINFNGLKQLKGYGLLELTLKSLSIDKGVLSLRDKTKVHAE